VTAPADTFSWSCSELWGPVGIEIGTWPFHYFSRLAVITNAVHDICYLLVVNCSHLPNSLHWYCSLHQLCTFEQSRYFGGIVWRSCTWACDWSPTHGPWESNSI